MVTKLTPELLLHAYKIGLFPMAESAASTQIYWMEPEQRGIFPLESFHISRSLARKIRQQPYQISINRDFTGVIKGCADRAETWINRVIFDLYHRLHQDGDAHSVEVWDGDSLVGGVYGVTVGRCFCGESMFSRRRDASKIALAYLVDRLRETGFTLFDTQYITPHLASLGAIEIPRKEYKQRLSAALKGMADFTAIEAIPEAQEVLQRNTQTS